VQHRSAAGPYSLGLAAETEWLLSQYRSPPPTQPPVMQPAAALGCTGLGVQQALQATITLASEPAASTKPNKPLNTIVWHR
jgi:hypothetical protein